MEPEQRARSKVTWKRCKDLIIDAHLNSDRLFYRIGLSIGTRPWLWLIGALCVSGVCGPGILLWKEEVDEVELFIPTDSVLRLDAAMVKEHFKDDFRYETIIVTAPNVLEPEVLQAISEIQKAIEGIVVNNQTWEDVCAGYLTWFKNNSAEDEDELEFVNRVLSYFNDTMSKNNCIYQSLLTLWQNKNVEDFSHLTKEEILNDVYVALKNNSAKNPLLDVEPLLSNVNYDATGKVTGANATILNWILRKTNRHSSDWELEFIQQALFSNRTLPKGMHVYAVASRSYKDFLFEILNSNITTLFFGLTLITVYVIIMIGRCNMVQQRIYLSLMGVSVVGQSILSAYGTCYYMGYFYGPVHPILPFLLLGIGVDDMFVIMQSLENLSEDDKTREIPVRIAKALQQSGMSITITSITDIVAFAIGITTVMPFLESFCMFASMGILFLYIFEIMFFVSCLVFDERRLEQKRDGCCCRPRPKWKPNECSQRNTQQMIFESYFGPFIMKLPSKIIILLLTASLFGVNIWGTLQLEQNFDPLNYLDQDSYPIQFNNKLKEYFPKYGKRAGIYLTGVDYYEDQEALFQLVNALRDNPYINSQTVDAWFEAYDKWLLTTNYEIEDRDEYYNTLWEYLMLTKKGQSYIKDIKFDKLPINDYNITTSLIQIQHVLINTSLNQITAMQSIRESVNAVNLSKGHSHIAVFSQDYVTWTANKIIGEELIRNLGLEILTVGLVTVLMLRNLQASFWVICCVLCTLVDLLGSMYFLGLSIEISSSIMVLLCAGLAVDYAAHVGLEFTRAEGTKNERSIITLSVIGPAVFNGGMSTLLAFVLLSISKAYIFTTFFKLFTCVVGFGLFHGLVFLPVILSLLGPNERIKRRTIGSITKDHTVQEQNGYCTVQLSHNDKDSPSFRTSEN